MDKEITICNQHDTPLIWTFKFPGAEWFCMTGNHAGGMLGTGHKVEATPDLLEKQAFERKLWDEISPDIAIGRFWRKDCKECDGGSGSYHVSHMTDEEKKRHTKAMQRLENYANVIA